MEIVSATVFQRFFIRNQLEHPELYKNLGHGSSQNISAPAWLATLIIYCIRLQEDRPWLQNAISEIFSSISSSVFYPDPEFGSGVLKKVLKR